VKELKVETGAALRRAARERGPLPSIAVADALLDERSELTELGNQIALVVALRQVVNGVASGK
jgi:hypothetical protein